MKKKIKTRAEQIKSVIEKWSKVNPARAAAEELDALGMTEEDVHDNITLLKYTISNPFIVSVENSMRDINNERNRKMFLTLNDYGPIGIF